MSNLIAILGALLTIVGCAWFTWNLFHHVFSIVPAIMLCVGVFMAHEISWRLDD